MPSSPEFEAHGFSREVLESERATRGSVLDFRAWRATARPWRGRVRWLVPGGVLQDLRESLRALRALVGVDLRRLITPFQRVETGLFEAIGSMGVHDHVPRSRLDWHAQAAARG